MDIIRRFKFTRLWFWLLSLSVLVLMSVLLFYQPNYYKAKAGLKKPNQTLITPASARLPGKDPVEIAEAIAQTIYPATFADNKPGAVILVPVEDWRAAVIAAEIVHFPINAPILYTKNGRIPKSTLEEIKRLDPEGVFQDGNKKVILIGDVGQEVKKQLKKEKMKFRELNGPTPEELASILDDYKAMIHADHDDQVIIVPRNIPAYALIATSWVAHMGHSIFFASEQGLAQATRKSLAKRPQDAFIYVLGDDRVIPAKVMEELSHYGHVQRIPGKNPWEMAIGFAGYKDVGRNFGWWLGRNPRTFGWGIAEAGHNFTFVNPAYPEAVIPAAILSHMGKHGPFLLVKENELPEVAVKYLQTVQPSFTSPQEQLFNHGWIIGEEKYVSGEVQQQVDKLLQVKK